MHTTQITEQTQLQQQLIQNLVTYSQHDPQLVNRLISLLTEKNPEGMDSVSVTATVFHTVHM